MQLGMGRILALVAGIVAALCLAGCGSEQVLAGMSRVSEPLGIDRACHPTPDSVCDGPGLPAATTGPGAQDLAVWDRLSQGIWARRLSARSGRPIGGQARISSAVGVGSIEAAYNPWSATYLILWEPIDGTAAYGRVAGSDLRLHGPVIQFRAHDLFLYTGQLTPSPDGGFLFAELQGSHSSAAAHKIFLTRISSAGQVENHTSWDVAQTGVSGGQVHSVYDPRTGNYRVAWLTTGPGEQLASRAVGLDMVHVSPVVSAAIDASYGPDFALADDAATRSLLVAWLSSNDRAQATIRAQHLDDSGRAIERPASILTLKDAPATGQATLDRLQATPTPAGDALYWQDFSQVQVVSVSGTHRTTSAPFHGQLSTYSHASVANAAEGQLLILSTNVAANARQLYAQTAPLPR
jgi:hypothetical protein